MFNPRSRTPQPAVLRRLAASASAALLFGTAWAQQPAANTPLDPMTWVWPAAASDPELRRSIVEAGYTQQELRNIRSQLEALSGAGRARPTVEAASTGTSGAPSRPAGWAERSAPEVRIVGRGFRGLEAFYGSNGYINGPQGSIADRTNKAVYILAKGDRLVISWFIDGHHTGKLFGFPGTGKPLHIRETALVRYDAEGRIVEADFLGDDLALYTQAGGKVELPKDSK